MQIKNTSGITLVKILSGYWGIMLNSKVFHFFILLQLINPTQKFQISNIHTLPLVWTPSHPAIQLLRVFNSSGPKSTVSDRPYQLCTCQQAHCTSVLVQLHIIYNLEDFSWQKKRIKGKFSEYWHREIWIQTYPLMRKVYAVSAMQPQHGGTKGQLSITKRDCSPSTLPSSSVEPDVVSRAATLSQFTTTNQDEMLAYLCLLELWLRQDQNSAQVLVASRDGKMCSQIWSRDIYTTTSCSLYF